MINVSAAVKFVAVIALWLPTVLALSDAKFSTLIQTAGVLISTCITAVVGYMTVKLTSANKRRAKEEQADE